MPLFFLSYNSLKRILTIFSFSSQFLGNNSRIFEKKCVLLLSGHGDLPTLHSSITRFRYKNGKISYIQKVSIGAKYMKISQEFYL